MPFAFLSGWFTVCRSAWCLCTGSQTRRAWFTEEAHLQRYSMIRIENIETMTPQQERDFWTLFSSDIARDDGAVARRHLDAGNPVYCKTENTPKGTIEKRFPDGRRQLVTWDSKGEHVVSELALS
jgi:hypothetical protein